LHVERDAGRRGIQHIFGVAHARPRMWDGACGGAPGLSCSGADQHNFGHEA
jgi:hypothetical protein